ncbi:MAG: hypothetical protein N2517_09320 [Ignavibacteria bacterium]|nr:hypothetical protein [Ignavibacteria bacterium]
MEIRDIIKNFELPERYSELGEFIDIDRWRVFTKHVYRSDGRVYMLAQKFPNLYFKWFEVEEARYPKELGIGVKEVKIPTKIAMNFLFQQYVDGKKVHIFDYRGHGKDFYNWQKFQFPDEYKSVYIPYDVFLVFTKDWDGSFDRELDPALERKIIRNRERIFEVLKKKVYFKFK